MNDPIIGNPFNILFASNLNHNLYDWHKYVRAVRPDNTVSDIGTYVNGKVYVKRAWFLPAKRQDGIPILDATYQVLKGHSIESLYNKLCTYACNEGEFSHIIDLQYNCPGCVSAVDMWKYEDPRVDSIRGRKNAQRIVRAITRFIEYASV